MQRYVGAPELLSAELVERAARELRARAAIRAITKGEMDGLAALRFVVWPSPSLREASEVRAVELLLGAQNSR